MLHTYEQLLNAQATPMPVAYKSPIQRVVALLKKMKAELEADGKKEAEMYDKMVCWCETNEKEKVKAIADADAKDADLTAEIEERAAAHGKLATDIEYTKGLIIEAEEALKKARAVREGEAAEFRDGEKDLVQAINNLRNAIAVLSRHHGEGGAMLQLDASWLASVKTVLRDVAQKYDIMLGDKPGQGDSRPLLDRIKTALIAVDRQTHRVNARAAAHVKVETEATALDHVVLRALDDRKDFDA